jgi:hypothetical protein
MDESMDDDEMAMKKAALKHLSKHIGAGDGDDEEPDDDLDDMEM